MTLYEHIAIANSIILSLAAVRLLDAIPHAFDPARRYWIHCAFIIVILWATAQYWWISWTFAHVDSWTYAKFLLYLVPPAILYSTARTLGSPNPSQVSSFRGHFTEIRTRFFALLVAYMFFIVLGSWLIVGVPLLHPIRLSQFFVIVLALSGAFFDSSRHHAVLAGFFLLALFLGTVSIYSEPAPLSPAY